VTRNRANRRGRAHIALMLASLTLFGVFAGVAPTSKAAPTTPSFGPVIDDYQPYDGQDTCKSEEQPGVKDFRTLVLQTYPGTRNVGIHRECNIGAGSEHKEGRAWDWGVNVNIPSEKAAAEDLLVWLLKTDAYGNKHANARRLGIMYVIWNHEIWKSYQSEKGWQPYDGPNPHTDHVHFSFSWAGAKRDTTWWHPAESYQGDAPASASWGNWQSLEGSVTSAPDAASWGAGRLDVFVRGYDSKSLKWRAYTSTAGWGNWISLGAPCSVLDILDCRITSSPTAVSWGTGRIDVFARGPDDDLCWIYYRSNVAAWSEWDCSLGSPPGIEIPIVDPILYDSVLFEYGLNSGPDAATWYGGHLYVIAVGYDGRLWRKWYTPSNDWSDWGPIPGTAHATSDPGVVARKSSALDVFYRNQNNDLVHIKYADGAWQAPVTWATTMRSGPDVASWGEGRLDVFWRGQGNELRQKTWTQTGGWLASTDLGGTLTSAPSAVSDEPGQIDVFVRGYAKDVKYRHYG